MRRFNLFKITFLLLILWAALIIPVSALLPISISFENNIFENAQVAVLLMGSIACICFSRQTLRSPTHKLWLPAAIFFLILAFRELSWGRVFFVQGYSDIGEPILIASSEMPYRIPIHAAIGILAIICLYLFVKNMPWKQIFTKTAFPWGHLALIMVSILLSTWGDHHTIFYSMRDQVIEEMAELLMYLVLCHTAWYVYLKLK